MVAAVSLPVGLYGAAVAAAAMTGGPSIERVQATTTIVFEEATINRRACQGAQGTAYAEHRVRATGTASGDSRLSGEVEVVDWRLFFNEPSGDGWESGVLRIRDPATGALKVKAVFELADWGNAQGSLTGRVRVPGAADERFRLAANMRINFNSDGSVVAQIGGALAEGQLPTILAQGRCTGPWETYEVELPPPGGDPAPGATSSSPGLRPAPQ